MHRHPALHALTPLTLALLLAGCAVGPDFVPPAPEPVPSYAAGGDPAQAGTDLQLAGGAAIEAQWWTLYGSPELDALVRQALDASPSLAAARARLEQARESVNAEAGSRLLPAVDADVSGKRQKVDPSAYGVPVAEPPPPFTLYNAQISVSYTLDIWGANRRAIESATAAAERQQHELDAATRTLAANVVTAALRLAGTREQRAALQAEADAQAQQFDIMQARLRAGGVAERDVSSQAALLAQTRAGLAPLQLQEDQLRHQLSVYLGLAPSAPLPPLPDWRSLALPAEIPLGVPADLTRRRPDVLAAEAAWRQAAADVGVATANLYPRFTLTGAFGSQRTHVGDVADGVNVWNLGLGLTQPLFQGGALRARKRGAEAAYRAAAADYRDTALQAMQQTADALRQLERDAQALAQQRAAEQAAAHAHAIAQAQWRLGGISEQVLLDAQRDALRTRQARLQSETARYTDSAALMHALGGDWRADDGPAR